MIASSSFGTALENVKTVWRNFDLKKWSEAIGGTSAQAIQAAVYFAISFVIGILFKRYFKILMISTIFAFFIIAFLHYNKMGVIIDFKTIKTMIGAGDNVSNGDMNAIINHFFDWIHTNMMLFISVLIGFYVGYKLG